MITQIARCNIQLIVQDELTRLDVVKNEKKTKKKKAKVERRRLEAV